MTHILYPTTIASIRDQFVSEATAAKSLFADLAKIELYIAESYRSRAFIELLQNADDAGATQFLVRQVGDKLLVANNGRIFSADDIISLCRSGASNKQRGSGTIGYRGIGFKSVAGISTDIDVISGEYAFRFSKPQTQKSVGNKQDVPLIRIPHPLLSSDPHFVLAADLRQASGMSTVFIFSGLNQRMVLSEAQEFDESAMLFLNHIRQVQIDLPECSRDLKRTSDQAKDGCQVDMISGNTTEKKYWLVAGTSRGCEKIAFSFSEGRIVPTLKEQSVVHAFMPTLEFSGAFLKIHGDFSTDPSRKSVDLDALSTASFERGLDLLVGMVRTAISKKILPGIFSSFPASTPAGGRFQKILREGMVARLSKEPLLGLSGTIADICLAPEWLAYKDYEAICHGVPHIPKELLDIHPELPDFLRWLGAKPLGVDDALVLMQHAKTSAASCAQLICRIARQYRFDLAGERLDCVMSAPLLPLETGERCAVTNYAGEALDAKFKSFLAGAADQDEIRHLLKRLNLPSNLLGIPPKAPTFPEIQVKGVSTKTESAQPHSQFKSIPAIKQWRSAEQNALAWFSALTDVLIAKDVSQANIGYDLEVAWRNGRKQYVEVKSVTRFGEPVRMTNNEYATAFQLGKDYCLAFVVNGSDQFDIRFVFDPARSLQMEKRCEQWSWYCSDYGDLATELKEDGR